MHETVRIHQIKPAILLSLALHGTIATVLWMSAAHRTTPQQPRIVEVTLIDWPRETSTGISTETKPSRPTRQVQRLHRDLAVPQTAQPLATQEAPSAIDDQPAQSPVQSAAIESPEPVGSEEQSTPQSQTGPTLFPPKFEAAYLHNPKPDYPSAARRFGFQGTVVLRVLIGVEGNPTEIRVEKSSGHNVLDEAALAAVKQWQFEPAREGDSRVAGWVDVPIQFRLE